MLSIITMLIMISVAIGGAAYYTVKD